MSAESDRVVRTKAVYRAYQEADREAIEQLLAPGFHFHAPPDPDLDRAGYFERCWPGAGRFAAPFEFVRAIEAGEEVVVTYVATRADGTRFRNTEVTRLEGEQVVEQEVYFGWDLESGG